MRIPNLSITQDTNELYKVASIAVPSLSLSLLYPTPHSQPFMPIQINRCSYMCAVMLMSCSYASLTRGHHQIFQLHFKFQITIYTPLKVQTPCLHTKPWTFSTVAQPTLYNIVSDPIDYVGIVCYMTMHA